MKGLSIKCKPFDRASPNSFCLVREELDKTVADILVGFFSAKAPIRTVDLENQSGFYFRHWVNLEASNVTRGT